MKSELVRLMSTDMNIQQYIGESDIEFAQRIIYSAMACWIKAACLDRDLSLEGTKDGISKKHITERCTDIIDRILNRIPELKPWFYNEKSDSPVKLIRERLIKSGDISNIGFDTDMTISQEKVKAVSHDIEQICGVFFGSRIFYSGVSALQKSNQPLKMERMIPSTEWFKAYCMDSWWKSGAITAESKEFFDCDSLGEPNHSRWIFTEIETSQKVRLVRIPINKYMYEYYLEKTQNGIWHHHKIDPFLLEIGEHRRIMLVLRKMANHPARVYLRRYCDHIKINIRVHLPQKEQSFLESYAWPSRSIADVLEWTVPLSLTNSIRELFINMEFEIMEADNG